VLKYNRRKGTKKYQLLFDDNTSLYFFAEDHEEAAGIAQEEAIKHSLTIKDIKPNA
tara:strand:+ start:697 stop:864 length:168 start_codon:yes stop_codon:yes gene_type:complete